MIFRKKIKKKFLNQKKFIILLSIPTFLFLSLFFLFSKQNFSGKAASATTYYVCDNATTCNTNSSGWVTGNDANFCNSKVTACKTIRAGILKMFGGDNLIIGNGIYTGTSNRMYGMPSGSASAYTKIHAENDWGVTISNPTATPIEIGTQNNPGSNYIEVRGMRLINHTGNKCSVWGDYVKIIRCAADGSAGAGSSFVAYGNYILFEECYSWGGPNRYVFRTSHALGSDKGDYVIFRRCVTRWDYSNTNEPQACFANYDTSHTYYQNCIAIDGKDIRAQDVTYDGLKGFFTPNGADDTHFDGCISLNMEGTGYWIEDAPVINVTLTNSIAWDSKNYRYPTSFSDGYPSYLFRSRDGDGPLEINHCNFGVSDLGLGIRVQPNNSTFKNSIIYNVFLNSGIYALHSGSAGYGYAGIENYNSFYGNTGNRNRSGGVNANDIENINPKTNSLLYLPRIEANSDLSNQADDGGAIGATILKKIGVSGTLYGEPGWDETTNENLWPFPNEEVIKKEVASFYRALGEAYAGSPEMIGARGFAADGNGLYGGPITLTSYIWEYLGNACPSDICNYGSTPPPIPSISLTKQVDPVKSPDGDHGAGQSQVQVGDSLTYTLTYQNTSSVEAKNIVITDNIPEGTSYTEGSATNGGVYDSGANQITWIISSLTAGASGEVSFKVKLK